jgi:hypothetical protein
MTALSLLLLALAVVAYGVSQLQQHGKLRWMSDKPFDLWGKLSHRRKYKRYNSASGPRFFLSTTWLVFLTDGYHFMQFWQFNFIALAFTFAIGFNWWLLLSILIGIRIIHFITYRLLQR